MFCTKCGKQIDYDAIVCKECEAEAAAVEAPAVEEPVTETPAPETPAVDTAVEAPVVEAPVAVAPVVEAPVAAAPVVEAPVVEAPVVAAPVVNPAVVADPTNKMFGFGKALTSTILSFFAIIFSGIALGFSAVGFGMGAIGLVLFYPGAIAMSVISLIFGIKSITTFKARSKAGCAKPIATLVLGINGVACAALAFLYIFLGAMAGCTLCLVADSYYY